MANIKKHLDNIKGALFGKDVRSSIHDGIDAINKEVESTTNRQEHLEDTFDQLVINSGNSNAEIVDARVGENGKSYAKLGDRLDEVDSQLEHIKNKTEINVKDFGAIGGINNAVNDTEAFLRCFEYANEYHKNVIIPHGEYYINNTLISNGTYTIKGHNAKIICNSDSLDSLLIINKSIEDLNKMVNIYDSGIDSLHLEGNGNCNQTLYIKQGKAISLSKLVCRGGKKYSCLLGSDKGLIWELNIRQCEFNANFPNGEQGEYSFYMEKNLSDNFISDCYFINGSQGWARFCSAATSISHIHGYSYPAELAPEIGFHVYASSTSFYHVICDTPGKIGMRIEGNGCEIYNQETSKFAHDSEEFIACDVKANNVSIVDLGAGTDINNDTSKITGVLLDTKLNKSITDFKLLSFLNHTSMNKDISVTGKIPYRFTYDKNSISSDSIKIGNFLIHNNWIYNCVSGTTKTINFKNEFSSSLYNVNLYEITGKAIPKHAIIYSTTGFTIKFLEDVTETLNIRAVVTMC